jgi:hypothetical protein
MGYTWYGWRSMHHASCITGAVLRGSCSTKIQARQARTSRAGAHPILYYRTIRVDHSPMTTPQILPQISGKYQFQVDLKGLRLPVTFTVPDIPDMPPSDEHFDPSTSSISDKETGFEETSNTRTQRTRIVTNTEPLDVGVNQANLLSVSAYYATHALLNSVG